MTQSLTDYITISEFVEYTNFILLTKISLTIRRQAGGFGSAQLAKFLQSDFGFEFQFSKLYLIQFIDLTDQGGKRYAQNEYHQLTKIAGLISLEPFILHKQ